MSLEASVFSFIDTLTALDAFCMIVTYAIYALLIVNIWSNFRFVKFAKQLHITIFSFVLFTNFCLYLCGLKSFATLFSNVFVDIVLLSSILIYMIYFFHRTFICYSIKQLFLDKSDRNAQSDNYRCRCLCINNTCNFDHKTCPCAPRASGTYCDYKYYYINGDKYAEPYTTPVKTNILDKKNDTVNFKNGDSFQESASKNLCNIGAYFTDSDYRKSDALEQLAANVLNEQDNNNHAYFKDNSPLEEKGKNSVVTKKQSRTKNNEKNLVQYENMKTNSDASVSQDTVVDSVKESEENILSKVETVLQNNGIALEKKFGSIESDVESLRNSIQGVVDRMTKLFELLAVALQENKKTNAR